MRILTLADLLRTLGLIMAVVIAAPVGGVLAQEGGDTISQEEIDAVFEAPASRNKSTVPNALDSEVVLSKSSPFNVRPNEEYKHLNIPVLAGFQQMADNPTVKRILREMIPSQVSVLYSTMMMVENGAATGFMQSMGATGSLLSQTMQNSQLQMQIYGVVDPHGEKQLEYVRHAIQDVGPDGRNRNFWPAALWSASGDKTESKPPQTQEVRDSTTGATAGDTAPEATGGQSGAQGASVQLSAWLFATNNQNAQDPQVSQKLNTLREELLEWVGDYTITTTRTGLSTTKNDRSLVRATALSSQAQGGLGTNQSSNVFDLRRRKVQEKVWRHINNVMRQYCEFKQNNTNHVRSIFSKDLPASSISQDDWKQIFSVDIQPSVNLVDQLFKLFLGRRSIEEIRCQSFQGTPDTMPEMNISAQSGSTSSSRGNSNTSFDSCENQPKTCLLNQILLRIVVHISESRLNYYYRWLWDATFAQVRNYADAEYSKDLFCEALALGQPCEPNHEFSLRLEENRVGWIEFSNKLSKFAQGQGGSTVFRPASSNDAPGGAGAVGGAGPGGP